MAERYRVVTGSPPRVTDPQHTTAFPAIADHVLCYTCRTVDRTRRSSLPILALLAVILIAGIIYFTRLETTPPHVSGDEAHFAVHALALAVTGRDDNGTALPLFFHLTDPVRPERRTEAWWQPMLFYAMAAALRVAPLSATTIRMVVAVVALVNIVLIYAVARRWFSSAWYGVLAAALLALTPAHVMLGRQATDYFLPLPSSWPGCTCCRDVSRLLECGCRRSPE